MGLPVTEAEKEASATLKPLAKYSALIVDDDPDVVLAIKMVMESEMSDFAIYTAGDGVAAVEMWQQKQPKVIILDMMLPKRSGFLVLDRVRSNANKGKGAPVIIMITGNLGMRHQRYAESLGVNYYLTKPFKMERLMGIIRAELEKQEKIDNGQSV